MIVLLIDMVLPDRLNGSNAQTSEVQVRKNTCKEQEILRGFFFHSQFDK